MSISRSLTVEPSSPQQVAFNAALDAHLAREAQIRSSKKIAREVREEAITYMLQLCAVPIAWLAAYGATELFFPNKETFDNPSEEIRQRFDENRDGKLSLEERRKAREFYSQRLQAIDSMEAY